MIQYPNITMTYEPGAVVVFTRGSYSDYEMLQHAKIIKPTCFGMLEKEFIVSGARPINEYIAYDENEFISWLLKGGWIELMDVDEIWL